MNCLNHRRLNRSFEFSPVFPNSLRIIFPAPRCGQNIFDVLFVNGNRRSVQPDFLACSASIRKIRLRIANVFNSFKISESFFAALTYSCKVIRHLENLFEFLLAFKRPPFPIILRVHRDCVPLSNSGNYFYRRQKFIGTSSK